MNAQTSTHANSAPISLGSSAVAGLRLDTNNKDKRLVRIKGAEPPSKVQNPPSNQAPISCETGNRFLSDEEQKQLQNCETVIERGWHTFVEVGKALAKIRDLHLYKQKYDSFEVYCREKWQYGRAYSYRLIAASEVVACLTSMGDKVPQSEAQVRPLMGLSREDIIAAWQKAIALAGNSDVTGKQVRDVVDELKQPKKQNRIWRAKNPLASENGSSSARKVFDLVHTLENSIKTRQSPNLLLKLLGDLKNAIITLDAQQTPGAKQQSNG